MIRRLFTVTALCFVALGLKAQNTFTVTGRVLDKEGLPVIGAGIQDHTNRAGTVSDLDGNFTIEASSGDAELHFLCIGMLPKSEKIAGRKEMTVVMEADSEQLEEVVVTALGIKRSSRALGYAVVEIKGEDVTAGHDNNLMSALSGKVPGVDISSTGGGVGESTRVIIRGNSQLSGSNMPLYVIDGVPIDNTQMGSANEWGGNDMGDGISSLASENVESVSVLKGASAAALYGSRASNGVVLITTKSGRKQQGLGIDFSSNIGLVRLLSSFDDYQREYGNGRSGAPPMNIVDAAGTTRARPFPSRGACPSL